jgi:hypothetical protein
LCSRQGSHQLPVFYPGIQSDHLRLPPINSIYYQQAPPPNGQGVERDQLWYDTHVHPVQQNPSKGVKRNCPQSLAAADNVAASIVAVVDSAQLPQRKAKKPPRKRQPRRKGAQTFSNAQHNEHATLESPCVPPQQPSITVDYPSSTYASAETCHLSQLYQGEEENTAQSQDDGGLIWTEFTCCLSD